MLVVGCSDQRSLHTTLALCLSELRLKEVKEKCRHKTIVEEIVKRKKGSVESKDRHVWENLGAKGVLVPRPEKTMIGCPKASRKKQP